MSHVLSTSYDLASAPWATPTWLDRADLRLTRSTAVRALPLDDALAMVGGAEGWLRSPRDRESEISLDVGVLTRYAARLAWSRGRTADFLWSIPATVPTFSSYTWANVGAVERHGLEALLQADLIRQSEVAWSASLVLDRGRQRLAEFTRAPFLDPRLQMRMETGAVFGQLTGYHWLRTHHELRAVHAGSHGAFVVNDDGLLVAVGEGGSLTDHLYGTVVEVDGVSYEWGYPILWLSENGSPFVRIGDRNPDVGFAVGSSLRWRSLTMSTVLSGQIGGDVYDHLRQRAYSTRVHADVDQAGKPPELRKPVDYYRAFSIGVPANDFFVRDATHLRVRELSLSWAVPRTRALTLSLVGRNIATWSGYGGISPEALIPTLRPEHQDALRDVRLPQPRSVALHVRIGQRDSPTSPREGASR